MSLNPPSKTVKGLAEGTIRTTMTHLEVGDVILVMTATADPNDFVKAAPTVAPKRAFWVTVASIGMSGIVVVAEDGDRIIITDVAPQTAVTIRDREIGMGAASVPAVTVTGNWVHPQDVPCGMVLDGDDINGVTTDVEADCPACLAQPSDLIAGDGTVITVGSRVTVAVFGESAVGTVTSLAECHEGEWHNLVTVRLDGGQAYGFSAEELVSWVRKDWAMVPGCPTCVLPMTEGHQCSALMMEARGAYMAEGMPTPGYTVPFFEPLRDEWDAVVPRRERKTYATVHGLNKHKSTRLNRRRKQVAA